MSRKTVLLAIGGGLLFAGFALIRLPAALLAKGLPADIRLEACEGTLWQGRAAALGIRGQVVQQALRWQFSPRQLWQGQLRWDVHGSFGQIPSQLTLVAGPTRVSLQAVALTLPAAPLLGLHPKIQPLKLGGILQLNSPRLALDSPSSLDGQLRDLFSPLAPTSGTLGSYRFTLSHQPGQAGTWQVSPQQGSLAIRGNGQLDLTRASVRGTLSLVPQGKALDSLKPLLATLPSQNGAYTLSF